MDQHVWQDGDPGQLAPWAARALAEGACIRFPCATVRAAREAEKLDQPGILVSGLEAALEWAPDLGEAGQRIARKLWPGPAILLTREGAEKGLASQLPPEARAALGPALRLCPPGSAPLQAVLSQCQAPLACSASGEADLEILDPTFTPTSPAILEAQGAEYAILAGNEEELRRKLAWVIVFVCTGNTCRSPMAEALFKQLLCSRLGCEPGQLPDRGWVVTSAGLAAAPGMPAAREAQEVVGPSWLEGHTSQPLTWDLASAADLLLGMTSGHVAPLRGLPARMLSPEGDITDPVGGPLEEYRRCAEVISKALQGLVEEMLRGAAGHCLPGRALSS
jgi:protein-tyrosine phosphatase